MDLKSSNTDAAFPPIILMLWEERPFGEQGMLAGVRSLGQSRGRKVGRNTYGIHKGQEMRQQERLPRVFYSNAVKKKTGDWI